MYSPILFLNGVGNDEIKLNHFFHPSEAIKKSCDDTEWGEKKYCCLSYFD